jgi:hypothetical protein
MIVRGVAPPSVPGASRLDRPVSKRILHAARGIGENGVARIGILAFGSLIRKPGDEIEAVEVKSERKSGVLTPFKVEFARASRKRGSAPTLVPHENGAKVLAQIIVVETTVQDAKDRLWRRELNKVGQGGHYKHYDKPGIDTLVITPVPACVTEELPTVIAATFQATIEPLTATHLAELAIASVAKSEPGRDGITYLLNAKGDGIVTPLSPSYEAEILRLTGAPTLEAARDQVTPA